MKMLSRKYVTFICLTLAACSGQQLPKTTQLPTPPPPVTAAPAPTPMKPAQIGIPSNANNIEEYKREIAHWISQRSHTDVYTTQPQALLRGVIVLSFQINPQGEVYSVRTLRSPGDAELEQRATASIWRASPLPRPHPTIMHGQNTLNLTETWLFNKDGRFQLRSIALSQKKTNF